MFNNRALIGVIILALLAWFASASFYVVNETERAIKLRFGEVIENDIGPGLHFKLPVFNTVRIFDVRVQTVDSSATRYLTADSKAVIVDSFVKWKIADPQQFYEATRGNIQVAENLIAPRTDEALRNKFGQTEMSSIIQERIAAESDNQQLVGEDKGADTVEGAREELMVEPVQQLDQAMRDELGVHILDIRVKRIELPPEVTQAVYERMNSERERAARTYRAEGSQQAEAIRADADRQRQEILANGRQEAETTRGEGDAQAAKIYASAYQQAPDFFSFYRSMQAYRDSFSGEGKDLLVLSPDNSDFFRYLKNPTPDGTSAP
ncbi:MULTISPECIES: protease modulator HflC [Salinicola]|uniref:Protein HflC n=1 Tax=Salinicola lusitanus TaxID=1949085 RepID=A0ABZ3CNA2_9GAMM|nr:MULTISPECIES: protease modulator HflC [Salinicola]